MHHHLKIEALKQLVRIGCTEEERAFPQTIIMDIELRICTPKALESDSVEDTVDYMQVVKVVETLTKECTWKLLEKLCFDVGQEILNSFKAIEKVTLNARKNVLPQAAGITARVEVTKKS